jgi:iron complex outermembrane receptor protein
MIEQMHPASYVSSVEPGPGLDFVEDFIGPISDYVVGGPAGVSLVSRPRNLELDAPNDSELNVWGTGITATWDFENIIVRSITDYREVENRIHSDLDGSPLLILDQRSDDFTQSQFFQEVQFIGESKSGNIRWLGGVYYFDEEQQLPILVTLLPGLGADLDFERVVDQSVGAFGSATFDISDRLALTVGGRYTKEDKDFSALRQTLVGGVVTFFEPGISASFTNFSPRATLDFQITDQTMTYLTYSHGFKSGGFNTRAASAGQTDSFDPEEVDNIEFGVKTRLASDTIQLNAAIFHMDYQDIQQQAFFVNTSGDLVSSVVNAAEATVQGIEAELLFAPTDNLDISASIGYTDAGFDTFVNVNAGDLSALILQDTPENTYNVGAAYTFDVAANWTQKIPGDYSHRSKMYFDRDNAEAIAEDGYSLINASVALISADEDIEFMIYGRNLGDEVHRVSGVNLLADFGYGLNYYGEPRVVGAHLSVRF